MSVLSEFIFLFWLSGEKLITFTDGIVLILRLDSIAHECTQTGWHLLTQTQSEWLIAGHMDRPWACAHFSQGALSTLPSLLPWVMGPWGNAEGSAGTILFSFSERNTRPLKRTKKRMGNKNFKWLLSDFTVRVLTQGMKYVSTVFQRGMEVSGVDITHLPHTQRLWLPSLELRGGGSVMERYHLLVCKKRKKKKFFS